MGTKKDMGTKELPFTLNTNGYSGIGELKSGLVVVQPRGTDMSHIWDVRTVAVAKKYYGAGPRKNARIEFDNIRNTKSRFLGQISKSLCLSNTHKLYTKQHLVEYIKTHIEIKASDSSDLFNEEFETKFYKAHKRKIIEVLSNKSGKVKVSSDLIFKYYKLSSPFNNNKYSILFQPSKYLNHEKDIWKLLSILGEEFFEERLKENHSIINGKFIVDTFRLSNQYFFISKSNRKAFSTINQRLKSKYEDISKLKLSTLLRYLNVDEIEELIEKGEKSY